MIRVSKEREAMVSPELQQSAINAYCDSRGYRVVEWVEGIDESGSRSKSAWWVRLDSAVGRVEAGEVDVIVVWKWSRAARHRLKWAVALDRVETAGGSLESATEQIDTTTSTGRFTRGMLAEMAAFEAERIGDTWKEAQARRVRMGLPVNGKPRFGYRYVEGRHVPDPDTGPVLVACYRRYVAGESVYALVGWLNQLGCQTSPGYRPTGPGPWTFNTLRRVMDSGFAAGRFKLRGEWVQGSHAPLIDEALWAAYGAAREVRRQAPGRPSSPYLLSGLVRCICGSAMTGGYYGTARTGRFRCHAAADQRTHPGSSIAMFLVEDHVRAWLTELVEHDDFNAGTDLQVAVAAKTARRAHDADLLGKEIAALDRQLATLTVRLVQEVVPEAAYRTARAEIEGQRAGLVERHVAALAETSTFDPGPIAADLLADWGSGGLPIHTRRAMLRSLINYVEVTPASGGARLMRVISTWGDEYPPQSRP